MLESPKQSHRKHYCALGLKDDSRKISVQSWPIYNYFTSSSTLSFWGIKGNLQPTTSTFCQLSSFGNLEQFGAFFLLTVVVWRPFPTCPLLLALTWPPSNFLSFTTFQLNFETWIRKTFLKRYMLLGTLNSHNSRAKSLAGFNFCQMVVPWHIFSRGWRTHLYFYRFCKSSEISQLGIGSIFV